VCSRTRTNPVGYDNIYRRPFAIPLVTYFTSVAVLHTIQYGDRKYARRQTFNKRHPLLDTRNPKPPLQNVMTPPDDCQLSNPTMPTEWAGATASPYGIRRSNNLGAKLHCFDCRGDIYGMLAV
jgi:hypothetical protein